MPQNDTLRQIPELDSSANSEVSMAAGPSIFGGSNIELGSEPDADGKWALLRQLGPVLPLTVLSAMATGVVGPGSQYIGVNYFAQKYTNISHADIHCELTPSAKYCKAAILDDVWVSTILSVVSPVMHFVLWPMLGAISDAKGRYPVILACTVLPVLPQVAAWAFFYCDLSLYVYFALVFLTDFPAAVMWFTYVIDRVPNQANRAAAFGILIGLGELFSLLGLICGNFLSLAGAFTMSLVLGLIQTCLIIMCLKESLPPEKRRPLSRSGLRVLLPWNGLRILVRDGLLVRLTIVLVNAGFVDGAFQRIGPRYLMKYMEWTTHAAYANAIIGQISIIAWLSLGLGYFTNKMGEGGVLLFGRTAALFFGIIFAFSWNPWQIWLLTAVLAGPMAMTLPSIAALKSKLVNDDEQGIMQSALTTVNTMASCTAAPIFGSLFEAWNYSDTWTPLSGAVILFGCLLTIPVCVMLTSMQVRLKLRCSRSETNVAHQSLVSMT